MLSRRCADSSLKDFAGCSCGASSQSDRNDDAVRTIVRESDAAAGHLTGIKVSSNWIITMEIKGRLQMLCHGCFATATSTPVVVSTSHMFANNTQKCAAMCLPFPLSALLAEFIDGSVWPRLSGVDVLRRVGGHRSAVHHGAVHPRRHGQPRRRRQTGELTGKLCVARSQPSSEFNKRSRSLEEGKQGQAGIQQADNELRMMKRIIAVW